jgi:hypothetical protein
MSKRRSTEKDKQGAGTSRINAFFQPRQVLVMLERNRFWPYQPVITFHLDVRSPSVECPSCHKSFPAVQIEAHVNGKANLGHLLQGRNNTHQSLIVLSQHVWTPSNAIRGERRWAGRMSL